jgi:hypothetical protein
MIQQMVMIVYNETIDQEVIEALNTRGIKNYTKVCGAFGRGETSGAHFGNDVWPGKNNVLYIGCSAAEADQILNVVKDLRREIGKEGLKAFTWNLTQAT